MYVHARAIGRRDAEDGQRAGVARELDLAAGELVPRLVVPQIRRDSAGDAEPSQVILALSALVAKRVQRSPEWDDARGITLGEAHHETIQEEIDRARRLAGRGRRARGLGDVRHPAAPAEAAREDRGDEGFEVGLPRQARVERFEAFRRVEQHLGSVAPASNGKDDLRPQARELGALELVELASFGDHQQFQRGVGRARP